MKTYSVATQTKEGIWITNWGEWFSKDDIDWGEVRKFCLENGKIAYGYYFGHRSRNLTTAKNRVLLWSAVNEKVIE